MFQPLRASRLSLVRVARYQLGLQRRISMAPTAPLRADLVQDLYLRELKNYKPSPLKASDASAHVQTFSPPKPPPSPEEIEIASDLKAYEAQTVEVEGQTEAGQEDVDELSKYFQDFGEEEDEAHH